MSASEQCDLCWDAPRSVRWGRQQVPDLPPAGAAHRRDWAAGGGADDGGRWAREARWVGAVGGRGGRARARGEGRGDDGS